VDPVLSGIFEVVPGRTAGDAIAGRGIAEKMEAKE
jgi:hypothetical protein